MYAITYERWYETFEAGHFPTYVGGSQSKMVDHMESHS